MSEKKRKFGGRGRIYLAVSAALLLCFVTGYLLMIRRAGGCGSFGRYSPCYYLYLSPALRGLPQPQVVGAAGYSFSERLELRWWLAHFESRATREEMHALARDYLLSAGYRMAGHEPVPARAGATGAFGYQDPYDTAVFQKGRQTVYVSVRDKEGGGIEVIAHEFDF